MSDTFTIYAELEAFEKAGDDHAMRIGGIVSTDALDADQERIVQEGLDFQPFLKSGWFNDNHGQKTTDVLGYPTAVQFVKKGETLPNGKIADRKGWWAEGYLLDTDEGRKVWGMAHALAKSPGKRRLGFSIEGKVIERDKKNPARVAQARVRNVAITHCPKNPETELHALVKALSAGHGIDSGDLGSGGALRTESLDDGPEHADETDGMPKYTVVHLCDPAESGGNIHKAEPAPVDELDYALQIADAFNELDAADPSARRPTLTKSEARIIARSRLPGASEGDIDALIGRHAR